jgi:hypothetical protein
MLALYRKRWEEKKVLYAKHAIIEGENLVVSCDDTNDSIDSIAIRALIEKDCNNNLLRMRNEVVSCRINDKISILKN